MNYNTENILKPTANPTVQNSPVSYMSKYQILLTFCLNFLLGEKCLGANWNNLLAEWASSLLGFVLF